MTQIIINHADGSKTPLFSRKNISAVSRAIQKIALLSEDVVSITITTATPLDLMIGDTTMIYGKKYKLNQLPQITKNDERNYTYELTLEGVQYDLIDVQYHLPEDCYGDTFYSDLGGHLDILMWNISRVYPGLWKLGSYPKDTKYTNFTVTEKNCLAALQEHCTNYGVEFEITSNGKTNTLSIRAKAGITHTFTLKYGRGRGLYQLSRANVNNAGITNRLFIYGGTENLGKGYGHTKLCLPGTTRLTSYLEDAESIAAYGVKENEKNYTSIKPGRIGTVTALGTDEITFIDSTMFDLNAKEADGKTTKYLIEGINAKIKFESGQLAGYEFDLHDYEHGTNEFVINKFKDENGTVFPSETSGAFRISVGDKYSILDIQLPQEYITEAETDLKEAGAKDFKTMTQPQVNYKLALTEGFFISLWGKEVETEILHVGDFIPIEDEQIGVNKSVRITRIERDLLKRHSYDITLSDTVTKTTTVRVLNEIEDLNEVITINKLADPAKARRRWLATQELLNMVFDPEGDYYSEKIKPLSIETQMLSVGAKSTQFTLQNITFQPNYGGNPNSLYVSSGTLIHYAIDPDALKLWGLSSVTFTNLTPVTAYYIYAKCPKNGDSGAIVLSATAKTVEAEAGYYNFLVGVLNSVVTDTNGKNPGRLVSLTYGSSTINGRFIRTGRIESSGSGSCYFDLDNNEIGGNIKIKSGSSGLKNLEEWAEASKDISAANESANKANDAVSDLNEYVDGAFSDGIITEAEAKAIEKYINVVKSAKADVEATYTKLYSNVYLIGTPKTNLLNAKVTFMGAVDELLQAINDAISDQKTTEAEKKNVDAKYAAFNTAYSSMSQAIEAANKAIQDTLKGYSDEALQAAKDAAKAAADAANSAGEANKAVGDLGDYVDGAFSDGIIEESEAKTIEKYINTVNATKSAVEATYTKLYANAYLSGTPKTNLLNAKVTLFGAISSLITSINTAIEDGKTTAEEKRDVDSKFTVFNSAYASFNAAVEAAYKAIQDTLKGYSDECSAQLEVLNTQITAQVTRVDSLTNRIGTAGWITTAGGNKLYASKQLENGNTLISYINQAAGATTIHSNKIDLEGAVTFSALSADVKNAINSSFDSSKLGGLAWRDAIEAAQLGSTIIVGGYLNTEYIKVNRIDANGAKVGGFTIESGRLYWKARDYFGSDSRSLKLGMSQTDTEGIVDVAFNAATQGRFGVKVVGSNMGGSAIYASSKSSGQSYPISANSYAGYFDGGVHVNGNVYCGVMLASEIGTSWNLGNNGSYTYRKGVSGTFRWSVKNGFQTNNYILEVVNGIVVKMSGI